MTYSDAQVDAATAAMDKHRDGDTGEVGAALAVVGLSAERAAKEIQIRDDMIRAAHRSGASLRQLAEVSGLAFSVPSADSYAVCARTGTWRLIATYVPIVDLAAPEAEEKQSGGRRADRSDRSSPSDASLITR